MVKRREKDAGTGWLKEVSRDAFALGSWVFYLLVIGRAFIGPYYPFVYQLIISAITLVLISLIFRDYEGYVARALAVGTLIVIFYEDFRFGVFTGLVFAGVVFASWHLGNNWKRIVCGMIIGGISAGLGYYLGFLV